ncbi:MAG TPA: hypothetical protein PK771_01380 [Spirochaetota bacterium]|nr:hypothetical protein [Spirochaetota bacterium]
MKMIYKIPLFFIFCFVGAFSTIYIIALDINPIVASSLVSIIVAFFTIIIIKAENHYSWASFCGSFAGMTSLAFIGFDKLNIMSLNFFFTSLSLSLFTAFLYALSEIFSYKFPKLSFDGYGGRLGTIAFISVSIFLLMLKLVYNKSFNILTDNHLIFDPFDLFVIPSAILASIISMEIKTTVSSLDDNYKVFTVATTGIIGGILVTKIPVYGNILGQAWYTGAFVGMSSYFVLMLKRDFVITGLISGILLLLTKNMFVGFGGKLGFISFLAVIVLKLFHNLFNQLSNLGEKKADEVIESLKTGENISNQNVDDDYAQKLIESLMKAKESGDQISIDNDNIGGSFVIGEKINLSEYEDEIKEQKKPVYNLDDLTDYLKSLVESFNSLNIRDWLYLTLVDPNYTCVSYQGVSERTVKKSKFIKNSKFINLLKNEKRVIGFSEKGMNQEIFTSRIDIQDLANTKMLIIFPIPEKDKLKGFFILLDKDEKSYKDNFELIREVIFNSENSN